MRIRSSTQAGIDLEASVKKLSQLRSRILDLLHGGGEVVSVDAEVGYGPSPYDTALSRLTVRRLNRPVCVTTHGEELRIVGSSQGLDAFCSHLAFDESAGPGQHSHFEYYQGHPLLSPDSLPLVITVGCEQAEAPDRQLPRRIK